MEELAVNIKICDRVYPMRVDATEEGSVRAAGKLINERVKAYSTQFGIYDQQDLLAMVAFDCLIDSLKKKIVGEDQMLLDQVNSLIQKVDRSLLSISQL